MSVREFGDHEGSSPGASTVASLPSGVTVQIEKLPVCDVKAMNFPSGDQSGSVGLGMPAVGMRTGVPPDGRIFESERRSESFEA